MMHGQQNLKKSPYHVYSLGTRSWTIKCWEECTEEEREDKKFTEKIL